jgi:DNA-binding winged helix-turn-helix (wHTH) protein/TolB-like protein/tetratricopeptide (TPR) repeat protein
MNEQSQPFYEFGPFSLNASKRLLLRNGDPVPLAPKVLETLLALIENRERVVTKDELLKQVWGDTIVEEGGLARNVSLLRKILGEKPDDHQYIVTVPARGYRFVADVQERWRDGESSGAQLPAPAERDGRRWGFSARRWLVLGGLAALGVGTFTYLLRPVRGTAPGPTAITSLAVLPLDNVSGDPALEYLADGMTEALITDLGKIGSVRVIARASVMKYKGLQASPGTVVRELGVQAVVTGSVLRSGDRLQITSHLNYLDSERQTWEGSHERDVHDVLTLQREVTAAIAGQLRMGSTTPAQARLGTLPLVNPVAYDSVLRARYLSVRTTDADTQAAIALLERAVALDPGFALAYADLASAYVTRLTFVTPEETGDLEQKAFAAAEKALVLDPDLAEAYLARGDLLWTHSQRFAHERAVQEFRRAVALNPNSDQAHRRLARVYVHVGFFDEALQHAAIALSINPSNAQALNSRAQALLWMGKDEDALATLVSIPGPVLPELVEANTAFALFRLGRREEAWVQLRLAIQKYPNDPSGALPGLEAMLLAESEPLKAQELIEKVAKRKAVNPSHHAAYFAACALARMRRVKEAVQYLREAAETGFPCYQLFAHDANLDPIRQDPRFKAFLAEMQKHSESLRTALFLDRK